MGLSGYNIRVYGILKNNNNEVLLSKETRFNTSFVKFPGGGHELGEGLEHCLQREFCEELGISVQVKEHLYTTDFFQVSAFNKQEQLISIYYWVTSDEVDNIEDGMTAKDVLESEEHFFYWKRVDELKPTDLTYPIDQLIAKKISQG